jgi:Mrp family chromosome partitioning ATPase
MSALDQAFIKAYSQQNPTLAAAAAEKAKKPNAPKNPVKGAVSVEPAKAAASVSGAVKTVAVGAAPEGKARSKRKTKSPEKSAGDSVFEAMDRSHGGDKATAKAMSAKKTSSARRSKKPTTPECHPPRAAHSKTAKKTRSNAEETTVSRSASRSSMPDVSYRLDLPSVTTDGGISATARPTVPAPHTDVIFSTRETMLPQREPAPSQSIVSPSESQPPRNLLHQKAEPAAENKTAASSHATQGVPSPSQPAPAFSDGWTADFTRSFSNLEQNSLSGNSPASEPDREEDNAKSPAEIFEALSASMKQYAAQPLPLPEKKADRDDAASRNRGNYAEKTTAKGNCPVSGNRSAGETRRPLSSDVPRQTAVDSAASPCDAFEKKPLPEKTEAAPPPSAPSIRLFQPMLQVDHFAWPKVCGRLESGANAELDCVIETVLAAQIRGKKVFVLGGCNSGDGATSLLLATARRLAAQDLKVALVEADWSQPQLARRLGLLPQYGWEDVLSGRFPLEEVLIESIAERLVILPVREPFNVSELPADASVRLDETWNSLRHHFDIVLVDPGPLCGSPVLDRPLVESMAGRIDAALMVKNLRCHDAAEFDAIGQSLGNAGAKVLGVVENFVG